MSFEEFYGTSARARGADVGATGPRGDHEVPESAPALHAALATFASQAQAHRGQVARGGPMPPAQVENWERMNHALDGFLQRRVARLDSSDLLRAQSLLETELERDGFTYGDIPAPLAEAVVLRVGRLAVRTAELRRLEQPPEVVDDDAPPRFSWPLEPVSITSLYGYRWHPVTGVRRRHLGIDLAATQGQAIFTADKGVVLRAGRNGDHGLQVEVRHEGRWVTRYSHLSRLLVEPGEVLERGHAVGLAGETGLATGVHLHFELWRDGEPMDPLEALGDAEPSPAPRPPMAQVPERVIPAKHQGRPPRG